MVSRKLSKYISALKLKKYRKEYGAFIVEGPKLISELIDSSLTITHIISTNPGDFGGDRFSDSTEIITVSEDDLKKISCLATPNAHLALACIPTEKEVPKSSDFILVLDGIKDPGNMGAILRLAEWFGVKEVVCSEDSVDCYNPKVVQSSMGSVFRLNTVYKDLAVFLKQQDRVIAGAALNGASMNDMDFPKRMALIIGSESHGISEEIQALMALNVFIPRFSENQYPESLNAAMAASIMLWHYKNSFLND